MSDSHSKQLILTNDEKPIRFLFENSAFLILGTVVALVWANWGDAGLRTHNYFFTQFKLERMFVPPTLDETKATLQDFESTGEAPVANTDAGADAETGDHPITATGESSHETDATQPHGGNNADSEGHHEGHAITWSFIINQVLMALFFAIAAKEVWESLLPGGALSNPRKAAMPLLATLGGITGPALLYVLGALILGKWATLGNGWAVPCATDIAFSYLVGRMIFGNGHPAIAFLLLLAIADDAAGLVIIAVAYPQQQPELVWMLMSVGAMVLAFLMGKMKVYSFWWYLLIPGVISWIGFYWAHIHPALGLVPIVPLMPHAGTDLGLFAKSELNRSDTLNAFEHWWKNPVEVILGLFGLCNAGVAFTSIGIGTWLVVIGLVIGKPLGITFCTWLGDRVFRLTIPDGMDYRDVVTLGCVAGIGFTVALFVSTAAFDPTNSNLDPIKMGALLSFSAAIISFVVAKSLGVRPWHKKNAAEKAS